MSAPLVSVITTSYHRARFIRETIESVLQQDYPFIEHIVVDGGSTDGTVEILQQYSQRGDRFRFVSEPDRGQSHAVNKGLAMARGEIIGWLNSDDTYVPGAVKKAVQAFQRHPDWAMIHGRAFFIDENGHGQGPVGYTAPIDFDKLFHGCFVSHPTVFIRKSVFQQIGGADETLKFCLDYDVWIRIARNHVIGFIDDFLANYRVHRGSQTNREWKTVGIPEILKIIARHYGTVSKTWMSIYLSEMEDRNVFQILRRFQAASLFGNPPKITRMNRHEDFSVPPLFRITLASDPGFPMKMLLVKGRMLASRMYDAHKFTCTVLVNGQTVRNYDITTSPFVFEIPLPPDRAVNQVDILSSKFSMADHSDARKRSFVAEEVIPLSRTEAEIYRTHLKPLLV